MADAWNFDPTASGFNPLAVSSAPDLRRLRVLVVDSYTDAADSLALLIQLWGHDVRIARNGPDALEVARGYHPDVAVLELVLAGLDGYELARRLRNRDLVLIAVSGLSDEQHRSRCQEEGFALNFVKPVPPDELQQVLARLAAQLGQDRALPCPVGLSARG